MSAADELELQAVAADLVAEFGRTVSLVPPGSTDVSATEPWKGKTAKGTAVPVKAVFQPMRKALIETSAIQAGDTLGIIASTTVVGPITSADVIQDGTRQWSIVVAIESKPGNSSFVWFLQLREAGA